MATLRREDGPSAVKAEERSQQEGEMQIEQSRADALYDRCAQAPQGTVFFQRDLANMAVASDLSELLVLLQELVDKHLFKLMSFDGDPCWKLRPRDEAAKLCRLTPDERMLYHHIDQAQTEGIWSKALRARTNMTPQALNKCLKNLESKDLVQMVMSVKHPNRKMYLLKHLTPSEEMAGGPWQSEGEFDMALIDTVSKIVEQLIQKDTCVTVLPDYNKYDRSAAIARKKAQVQGVMDIEDAHAPAVRPPKQRLVLLDEPKYPTAASLLAAVNNLGIIRDKVIQERDMEQLLEMMVLEGRLEKLSGTNYRLAMKAQDVDEGMNGFVDAPCGTCPVFDLCGDSGEITARTCVYFTEWLSSVTEEVV